MNVQTQTTIWKQYVNDRIIKSNTSVEQTSLTADFRHYAIYSFDIGEIVLTSNYCWWAVSSHPSGNCMSNRCVRACRATVLVSFHQHHLLSRLFFFTMHSNFFHTYIDIYSSPYGRFVRWYLLHRAPPHTHTNIL